MEDGQVMLYMVSKQAELGSTFPFNLSFLIFSKRFFYYFFICLKNSVNGRESRIPYPWLVFNEKVKVNSVFLRDSTGVPDSVLLLFGGNFLRGPLVHILSISKIIHLFGKTYQLVQNIVLNQLNLYFKKKNF
jgi:Oligonucleotide/oligosaccharide-binding (OB)-fold